MTARSVDRAQLFALDAASQAIEKANLMPQLTFGNKTAVILGTISGEKYVENVMRTRIPFVEKVLTAIEGLDGKTMANISRQLANRLRERYVQNSEDTIPGLLSNIVSARIVVNILAAMGPILWWTPPAHHPPSPLTWL